RVERLRFNRDLAAQMRGITGPIPPNGQRSGGQFIQGRGGGVAFRVQIPAWRFPQGKERIEIPFRSRADGVRRDTRERKIEENDVQFVAASDGANPDVVRLNSAMRDSLVLEKVDDAEQILPKALKQIDVESPILAESLAEGFLAGAFHQNAGS